MDSFGILPPVTGKSVIAAPSFGRLFRFHHVGIGKYTVIDYCEIQQKWRTTFNL